MHLNIPSTVSLTDVIQSFRDKSLIVITGVPMSGKTQLALRIAELASHDNGVLYISLDKTKYCLMEDFTSIVTGVSKKELRGSLSNEKLESIKHKLNSYSKNKILIEDSASLNLDELEQLCISTKMANKDLKLIILDRCNLVRFNETVSFRERMDIALTKLKHISANLNVSFAVVYSSRRNIPNIPDDNDLLKLNQNADVLFNTVNTEGNLDIYIDKNNFGVTGLLK